MAASIKNLPKSCKNALKSHLFNNWTIISTHRPFHTTENVCKTKAALRLRQNQRTERQLQRVADRIQGKTSVSKPKGKVIVGNPAISRIMMNGYYKQGDQLGRIYTSHVTEILDSGQVCPQLSDLGFCITQVNLRLDKNELRISWTAIETENDQQIEGLLHNCCQDLREALSAIPSMGLVPQIIFTKNNEGRHQEVVEDILKVADFGPDFVPTDAAAPFRVTPEKVLSAAELKRSLGEVAKTFTNTRFETVEGPGGSQEVLEATTEMEKPEKVSISSYPHLPVQPDDELIPDLNLRSDVYDLNQEEIMQQISHTKLRLSRLQIHSIPDEEPPKEILSKTNIACNQEIVNKVLGQYRRSEGTRSRKRRMVEKRTQCKRNLSMNDMHIIL